MTPTGIFSIFFSFFIGWLHIQKKPECGIASGLGESVAFLLRSLWINLLQHDPTKP
jgi:hypothetical protein